MIFFVLSGGENVVGILYMLEEIKLGEPPKLFLSSTEQAQYWGQGAKTNRNPRNGKSWS